MFARRRPAGKMRSQEVYRSLTQPPEAQTGAGSGPPPEPAPEESCAGDSCPHCDAAPMVGQGHTSQSWWHKLRSTLARPLCCFRFRYKSVYKCRSCGWRSSSSRSPKRCSYECKTTAGIES
ncbi:uncharacterized protein DMAD_04905 [Drosophila madeirensis]|uniref:Uncharacterized protein n=2 Tax=Drosophila madeirensis TaxID=30013 RepID=A0AAU9GF81_DROMD